MAMRSPGWSGRRTTWHGAIDRPGAELASTAFTFWQLDDFLAQFGDSVFRRIAELLAMCSDASG